MSENRGVIVQARMSSSRFPGKTMKEIGGEPLIFYVVKRLEQLGLPVVVCTSTLASDDDLCEFLLSEDIQFFRGSLENVLERYIMTAEAFDIDKIVRVTGDNPFVDISALRNSLDMFERYSYVDGIYEKGLIKGTGFELVTLSELKSISSGKREHLEHVTQWLRENLLSSQKRRRLEPNIVNYYRSGLYLTCDYPEDFELISRILSHFNYETGISLSKVLHFLDNNPELKAINRKLHD